MREDNNNDDLVCHIHLLMTTATTTTQQLFGVIVKLGIDIGCISDNNYLLYLFIICLCIHNN